jgi:thymidylate kinase
MIGTKGKSMKIVPIRVWGSASSFGAENGSSAWPEKPAPIFEKRRNESLPDIQPFALDNILSSSRILILEGISGSGKDTFQTHLKKKLKGRDVYDYSEGEVLHSWKQLQIEGIFELRVKFMKHFVNYVRDIVSRDENAVFLLNRFHLSTYASTIIQQPKLEQEYDEIINILKTLPVHVFILQVDENEIEKRSLHPERSSAWQKFQQQIAEKAGFRDRLEKQQKIILEAARRQQIPYSVIRVSCEPEIGGRQVRISEASSIVRRGVRMNAADAKMSRKKRDLPQIL